MARSTDFLYRYRDVLNKLRSDKDSGLSNKQERRTAARQARSGIRKDKAAAAAAGNIYQSPADRAASVAAIPQEFIDRYGSQAGSMYANSQVKSADLNKQYAAVGATQQDIDRYGSDALDVARARQLNELQKSRGLERLTAGSPEQRQQALDESYRLAQSAGIPAARGSKEATREFYTKEFAKFGDNPNVFGMKDLLEMRNRGESEGDIRRMALTIGAVGPQAQKALGLGYLNRNFWFDKLV